MDFNPSYNQMPSADDDVWCFIFREGDLFLSGGTYSIPQIRWSKIQPMILGNWLCIGEYQGQACVSIELTNESKDSSKFEYDEWVTVDLRQTIALLPAQWFSIAGRARQIITWGQHHQFCSRCGEKTIDHKKDTAKICPSCSYTQYPRVSPCIIALVHKGDEFLLARSPNFPQGMFSTLAGFIEAGETAEEAVHREVFEEVGVKVGRLHYISSQSWPFPHSLMLGFYAEWESGEINIDNDEIVEAHWYSAKSLPNVPPNGSIARQLIDGYLQRNS